MLLSSSSSSDEDDDDDDETAIQHDIFSLSSSPESAVQTLPASAVQPLSASAVQPLSAHKSDSIALNTVAFDVSGSQVCTIVVE